MAKTGIARFRNYRFPDKYGQWLGYKIDKQNRKKLEAQVSLKLRDDHLSPAGKIHGGVVSGFFDFAGGAAVFLTMGPEDFCSTVELTVNYFRPLNSGDVITTRVSVAFRGKRLCVVRGMIHRKGEKEPVAMGSATYNIVPRAKT